MSESRKAPIKNIKETAADKNGKTRRRFDINLDFSVNSRKVRTVLAAILVLLIVWEVVYQVHMAQSREAHVSTQTALINTIYKTIDADGFVIRQETPISYRGGGTVVSTLRNGSKVGVGDTVARIYSSPDAAEKSLEYAYLEEELSYYDNVNRFAGSTLAVANEIYKSNVLASLLEVEKAIHDQTLSELPDRIRALSTDVTRQQAANGKAIDVSARIASIQSRMDALTLQLSGCTELAAEAAGYYVNETDGYEDAADYDAVSAFTAGDVEALLNTAPKKQADSVGKLVTAFNWYLVCNIPEADADELRVGRNVKVQFPDAGDKILTLSVKAKNENPTGDVTLVLSGNKMDESIVALRKESIKIRVEEYTGFAVDSKAIRTIQEDVEDEESGVVRKEDVIGVYVRMERTARFRRINIIYSGEDFVLAEKTSKDGYLQLYDEIILEGTDLYDRKVLD